MHVNMAGDSRSRAFTNIHSQIQPVGTIDSAGMTFGTAGVVGTASNSQCMLNAGSSSVTFAGNNLTLNVALTFSSTFVGPKTCTFTPPGSGSTAWAAGGPREARGRPDSDETLHQYTYEPECISFSNSAASRWITPALTPGVAGTASNAICTLNAALSSVSTAGNNLTLNMALSFNQWAGPNGPSVYVELYAAGLSGQNSGWVILGTFKDWY